MPATLVSRRHVLLLGTSTLLFPDIGFAQDPGTIAAIGSAAIKIYQSINDAQADADWKSDVTARLDRIEGKVDRVLDQLNELRIFVRQERIENDLNLFKKAVFDKKLQLDILLATQPTSARRAQIAALIPRIQTTINEFPKLSYPDGNDRYLNYAGYLGMATAVVTLIVAAHAARSDKQMLRREIAYALSSFFEPAINPNEYRSFAWALNASKVNDATLTSSISVRKACVGINSECTETDSDRRNRFHGLIAEGDQSLNLKRLDLKSQSFLSQCSYQIRYFIIQGDVDNGFRKGDLTNEAATKNTVCTPYPGYPNPPSNEQYGDDARAQAVTDKYNLIAKSIRDERGKQAQLASIISDITNLTAELKVFVA